MNLNAYIQGYNFQKQALNLSEIAAHPAAQYGLLGGAIGAPLGAAYKYVTDPEAGILDILGYGGLGALGGGALGAGYGAYSDIASRLAEKEKAFSTQAGSLSAASSRIEELKRTGAISEQRAAELQTQLSEKEKAFGAQAGKLSELEPLAAKYRQLEKLKGKDLVSMAAQSESNKLLASRLMKERNQLRRAETIRKWEERITPSQMRMPGLKPFSAKEIRPISIPVKKTVPVSKTKTSKSRSAGRIKWPR